MHGCPEEKELTELATVLVAERGAATGRAAEIFFEPLQYWYKDFVIFLVQKMTKHHFKDIIIYYS